MKKLLSILILSLLCVYCMVGFTACNGVEFKINFIVDGEVYAIVNTNGTETVKMPDNPTKDDYTFDGWFWDNDVWEKPFTANSLLDAPLSSDMSVYAKFKSNHTHNYIETVTKEPTCTEKGEKTYTCECGDSYTEEMNALGHDFGAWTTIKAPTCTEKGTEIRYCLQNSAHFETRDINTLEHNFGEWIETTAPTCTTKGVETRYCSHNNTHTETRDINELGHEFTNYVSDGNATYYSDGTKTAVCERGCGEKDTITDVGSKLPEITEYFEKKQDGSYYGKIYNTTTVFDFNGKINYDGEYYVCTDINCTLPLTDYKTSLNLGDNVFYVLFDNGQKTTATVHRRLNYTVNFETGGGTNVAPQTIEEDRHLVAPNKNPMRVGYTFSEWNYDFNEPITDNTTITAIWNANTNTPYRIEYYLQNLEDDEYTLQENDTEYLTGTTDTIITATKTYDHFTVIDDTASANISPDGSLVLKVYYTRNLYTVNISAGEGSYVDNPYYISLKYGDTVQQITAGIFLGYEWQGWYSDGEFIQGDYIIPSFTVDKNINYVATCTVKNEMANFNFTSTETTCTITGIKDTAIKEIIVPDYITTIKIDVFNYCLSLTSINVCSNNETYKDINGNLYNKNGTTLIKYATGKSATEFTISDSVINIGDYAFYRCSDLTNITIPNSVNSIGSFAFYNCSSLTNITIPNSVKNIGASALASCSSLQEITIPFVGGSKSATKASSSTLFGYIFGTSNYIGGIATKQYYSNLDFQYATYYIPSSLRTVTVTGGNILYGAFSRCGRLENITISNETYIEDNAFYCCSNLTSITLSDKTNIKGNNVFYCCLNLTSIIIPNYITTIGTEMFYGCRNLTNITIGKRITSIEKGAFYNCDSLSSIYYSGTAEDWTKISISFSNGQLTSATRYYYSETEPTEEGNFWHYDTDGITPVIWVKEN